MKTLTGVLLGALITIHSATTAATEKPPAGNQDAAAGTHSRVAQDTTKPKETRPTTLKDELIRKKTTKNMSRKKEIKLNLCDQ